LLLDNLSSRISRFSAYYGQYLSFCRFESIDKSGRRSPARNYLVIKELSDRYNVTVGFSDHSAKIATGIAAVSLGAKILEFHVVFHRDIFGPDAKASLTIEETIQLVEAVNQIQEAIDNPIDKNNNNQFKELKQIFEKSLAVNKNLPKNHIITFDDLESKKPKGFGILALDFHKVIGRKLNKQKSQWDFLNEDDLE
jgi:N-acetylneuraminate synthase